MSHSSDALLIGQAKHNPENFGLLYEKYAERVFNYFYFHVNCRRDIAEDLRQETFLKAFTKIAFFELRDPAQTYLSYLLSIAHNLLVNYYRNQRFTISLDDMPAEAVPYSNPLESVGDSYAIKKAIDQLPFTEKEIFLLRYDIQLSIAEIAHAIQKTENAVKLMLSRTRKRLSANPLLEELMHFGDGSRLFTPFCSAAA